MKGMVETVGFDAADGIDCINVWNRPLDLDRTHSRAAFGVWSLMQLVACKNTMMLPTVLPLDHEHPMRVRWTQWRLYFIYPTTARLRTSGSDQPWYDDQGPQIGDMCGVYVVYIAVCKSVTCWGRIRNVDMPFRVVFVAVGRCGREQLALAFSTDFTERA